MATLSRWRYEFESRYPYKFIIPDRWVKSALEIWVKSGNNHISLAGGDIIECASRKTSHKLKPKYIGRDGDRTYFL